MRQAGGGGALYVDESQEYQVHHKEFCVMYPKNSTTIDLTITSEFDPMSMDITNDELFSTRAPIETNKPSYKPVTDTSSYSGSTPRTAWTSEISTSTALPAALT